MRENAYQAQLIKKLKRMFPGCIVLKNDTDYIQGIPDLTILYKDKWAMLEVKASATAPTQPNQEHYILMLDRMSFAGFIFPENESGVLYDLSKAFEPDRSARLLKR